MKVLNYFTDLARAFLYTCSFSLETRLSASFNAKYSRSLKSETRLLTQLDVDELIRLSIQHSLKINKKYCILCDLSTTGDRPFTQTNAYFTGLYKSWPVKDDVIFLFFCLCQNWSLSIYAVMEDMRQTPPINPTCIKFGVHGENPLLVEPYTCHTEVNILVKHISALPLEECFDFYPGSI